MKIEKGKYRTRIGEIATVHEVVENGQLYCIIGSIKTKDGLITADTWTKNGFYHDENQESGKDLIKEYTPDPTESGEFWNKLEAHLLSLTFTNGYKNLNFDVNNYFLTICQQKIHELK